MVRKTIAIIAVAFAAVFGLASPAQANNYPAPSVGSGTVSAGTVTPGGTVTFSGSGFAAGSPIDIAVSGPDAQVLGATANAEGEFSVQVTLSEAGTYTLTATGVTPEGGARVLSATVRVAAAGAGTGGTDDSTDGSALPRTGAEGTAAQAWAGIGLLGLGAGMVALTVSRRRQDAGTLA